MSKETLVSVDNVLKRYGPVIAVDRTSFDIKRGEFLAIMGSSGCGKTTTLRMLAGLEAPSEGEIRIDGVRSGGLPAWARETPMVWQSLALFPFLTVVENVEFGLKMRKVAATERRKRALTWLDRMGLTDFAHRNIEQLSGGQKQRVALARCLVTEPKILLLDEPLSALDAHLKVRMQTLLSELQRDLGITFVYVTHSQSEAFSMADRVIIMSRGRIEQIGAPVEIYRTPRNRFVAEFLGSANIFEGRIEAIEQDWLRVATSRFQARVPASPERRFSIGQQITFVVPEDRISVQPDAGGREENTLTVTILGEEFVGASMRLYTDDGNGNEVKALTPYHASLGSGLESRQEVLLSWNAQDAYVLPAD